MTATVAGWVVATLSMAINLHLFWRLWTRASIIDAIEHAKTELLQAIDETTRDRGSTFTR